MRVAIFGKEGPVARATREALARRGHQTGGEGSDCAICFPAAAGQFQEVVANGGYRRIVLRSHASAYGSSTKNPGLMTEERISLLAPDAPEQRWLELEAIAAGHPNAAIVRLTNILAPEEGDLLVRKISQSSATALAGRDPIVQVLSVKDGAEALVSAAESPACGLFNAGGTGAIPLKQVLRAAGTRRIPILKAFASKSMDQLQYNWTVSSDRAERELGWRPGRSTTEALADFLMFKKSNRGELLHPAYDDWGLDEDYIRSWAAWFWFLRNVYWRIEHEGLDNIPAAGRALFVSNHRGFMPLDAVMHLSLIFTQRRRVPRFLIIHSLLRMPFLCNFLTKLGGVIASRENAARLFAAENLVGIFPEGIRGAFTPYKSAYRLRDFSKSGFARMAIENQAPVIPAAVVGHAEIFPIIGRINSSYATREWGWPYLPIAPMFPLAPVPLPSKWHVRVLPAVTLQGLKPADAENQRVVKEFSLHVQHLVQQSIDEMVARRKHIFWGRILNGPVHLPLSRVAGGTQ
jgi:1-acyl-sn-glycerol-3-phosphate acyltransferase